MCDYVSFSYKSRPFLSQQIFASYENSRVHLRIAPNFVCFNIDAIIFSQKGGVSLGLFQTSRYQRTSGAIAVPN